MKATRLPLHRKSSRSHLIYCAESPRMLVDIHKRTNDELSNAELREIEAIIKDAKDVDSLIDLCAYMGFLVSCI